MSRVSNKWIALAAGLLATIVFVLLVASGKAADCAPNQVDGQCGLSTFLGYLYGGAAVIAIAIVTGILIGLRIWLAGRHIEPEEF